MSGSESKSAQEADTSSPNQTDRPSLADFLAPPRPRISIPAPDIATTTAEASTTAAAPIDRPSAPTGDKTGDKIDGAWQDASTALTPTEPTTLNDLPVARAVVNPAEATTLNDLPVARAAGAASTAARPSVAPISSNDASARSLIPVATGSSDAPSDDIDQDFELPGASPPWSSASVRRATFVALLAAAAAVPAWVVFRARTVDVQAHTEAPKSAAAPATPSTLGPTREIEADDDQDDPASAETVAVPVDPVKGLAMRQEARRLLEAGQIDPGVAAARRAIELNPADPECYVLLAAGLQDQGRWAESREVFSRCIHKSNDGINAECAYFANSGTITNR
jgi:hypothetical protein